MDARCKRLVSALLPLWLAASGCNSLGSAKNPTANPELAKLPKPGKMPDAPNPSAARAVAAAESRRNEPPKPETLVAIGAVRDQMAQNPEMSFAEAEQCRAEARKAYNQALALDSKNIPACLALAKSYANVDDAEHAVKMYDKATEIKPRDSNLWYDKGLMQARFKDWDGAAASLRQAQKIDPDNRLYSRMLGMTLARAGKFDEAYATLGRCMKEEEARYTMARMYQHLDRGNDAKEQLTLALKARPTFLPAREMLTQLEHPTADVANPVTTVGYQEPTKAP